MERRSPELADSMNSAGLAAPSGGALSGREITYLDGLAIVVGLQIGSGIFSTPAVVASNVQSIPIALLVWLAAGLLVWAGAASVIELGTRIPVNGGMQQYLKLCLGDEYGFLFAWTWIFVLKAVSTAMISTIFAEYLCQMMIPRGNSDDPSILVIKAVALIALGLTTALNCTGRKTGTRSAQVFLVLKVFGVLSIGILGLVHAVRPSSDASFTTLRSNLSPRAASVLEDQRSLWKSISGVADAMFAALFAYGGWECIGFVAGEVQDPARTLPRILHHSMAIVLVLFLIANAAIYSIVPQEAMDSDAIAVTFGNLVLGRPGAIMYSTIVCISCLGALNAAVFSVGRLTEAASQEQYMPRFMGAPSALHSYSAIPLDATERSQHQAHEPAQTTALPATETVPVILGALYLVTGSFRGLLTFKGLVEYIGYFCTILGLIKLQRGWISNPALTPPVYYHTPPFLPWIFSITSSLLVIRGGIQHPLLIVGMAGFIAFALIVRRTKWWQRMVAASEDASTLGSPG